jgi:hypothetical protein
VSEQAIKMKHELKQCARCNNSFECKQGDVINCQCYGIVLSTEAQDYIANTYNDCLCKACLLQLQNNLNVINNNHEFTGTTAC